MLSDHQLAVLKFEGVGQARLADRIDVGARGEGFEDRVHRGPAEGAHVGNVESKLARALAMIGPLPPSLVSTLTSSILVLRPAAAASRCA